MKNMFTSFILLIVLTLGVGCTGSDVDPGNEVHEITERFFAMQFFEISINTEEFLGRTIRYEGMFITHYWEYTDEYFHLVYRYTEGCCNPVEPLGLEVYLDGIDPLPDGAWVEVTGILERFDYGFLRLAVTSLIEKEERGAEFVVGLN